VIVETAVDVAVGGNALGDGTRMLVWLPVFIDREGNITVENLPCQ
jgi:hypothetical protein